MNDLIEELKKEHAALIQALGNVMEVGIGNSKGQQILYTMQHKLLAHLKKEDEELYPVLKKEAECNADVEKTLELFASEMEIVSQAALQFFEQYTSGGGVDFAKDFGKLSAALGARIRREENILFEAYTKIQT